MIRISRSLLVVSSCLALGACAAEDVASLEQNVIYDDDDRIEVYQDSDSARRTRAEQSIVALIPKGNLTAASNGYLLMHYQWRKWFVGCQWLRVKCVKAQRMPDFSIYLVQELRSTSNAPLKNLISFSSSSINI